MGIRLCLARSDRRPPAQVYLIGFHTVSEAGIGRQSTRFFNTQSHIQEFGLSYVRPASQYKGPHHIAYLFKRQTLLPGSWWDSLTSDRGEQDMVDQRQRDSFHCYYTSRVGWAWHVLILEYVQESQRSNRQLALGLDETRPPARAYTWSSFAWIDHLYSNRYSWPFQKKMRKRL